MPAKGIAPLDALVEALSQRTYRTQPYRYQLRGLAELVKHPRWLLGWECGLGKSLVVAERLRLGFERGHFSGRVLIVCPKSVLAVWPEQLQQHAGLGCLVLTGDARQRAGVLESAASSRNAIVVTNYEVAWREVDRLAKLRPDVVVADESHRIKNSRSLTARAVRRLGRQARFRWALSGTPTPNGPLDIHGTLAFLDPKLCGGESFCAFRARYAITRGDMLRREIEQAKQRGIDRGDLKRLLASGTARIVLDYQNLDELERIVSSVSSRLRKVDALDLPEKTFVERRVPLSASASRVYRDIRRDALALLESKQGAGTLSVPHILTQAMRLLQVAGGFVPDDEGRMHALEPNAKLNLLADVLEDIDGQVVIWAGFVAEARAIWGLLGESAVAHEGSLSFERRLDALRAFKSGEARYLIATPQSAREGLTLTEASTAVFYSRTYNLLDWLQAQDRVHRIGQRWPVTIISLIAEGTVDENVARALSRKADLQELVLSGTRLEELI